MLSHASNFSATAIHRREATLQTHHAAEIVTTGGVNLGLSSHGFVNSSRGAVRLSSVGIEEPMVKTSTGQLYGLR